MWYGKSLFQIYNDVDRACYESIKKNWIGFQYEAFWEYVPVITLSYNRKDLLSKSWILERTQGRILIINYRLLDSIDLLTKFSGSF